MRISRGQRLWQWTVTIIPEMISLVSGSDELYHGTSKVHASGKDDRLGAGWSLHTVGRIMPYSGHLEDDAFISRERYCSILDI
ncbi:hypothetical protein PoB_003108400 [Plakobranchus ocellatus]|uniref:Uncharacterized protein n=1 Tax=Plakobranchus ocellatus TaxID=259542 RepID=A0AAV4AA94_9GAST|nr:hypothetical protein PoB_003108400 [Plakobranchus ocellatus]